MFAVVQVARNVSGSLILTGEKERRRLQMRKRKNL